MKYTDLASHILHERGAVRVAECFGACGCRQLYVLASPLQAAHGIKPRNVPKRIRCDGGHIARA